MKRKIDSFLPRPLSHSDELEFRTEQEVKDGIARNVVRVVTVSPTERMANLKSSDYALGNIIAAGAVGLLRPTILSADNLEADIASVQAFADKLDAETASVATSSNP